MVSAVLPALTWWESVIPKSGRATVQKGNRSPLRALGVSPWMLGVVWCPPCSISAAPLGQRCTPPKRTSRPWSPASQQVHHWLAQSQTIDLG